MHAVFGKPNTWGLANVASMRYVERLAELLARFRLEFHAVLIDAGLMCWVGC